MSVEWMLQLLEIAKYKGEYGRLIKALVPFFNEFCKGVTFVAAEKMTTNSEGFFDAEFKVSESSTQVSIIFGYTGAFSDLMTYHYDGKRNIFNFEFRTKEESIDVVLHPEKTKAIHYSEEPKVIWSGKY